MTLEAERSGLRSGIQRERRSARSTDSRYSRERGDETRTLAKSAGTRCYATTTSCPNHGTKPTALANTLRADLPATVTLSGAHHPSVLICFYPRLSYMFLIFIFGYWMFGNELKLATSCLSCRESRDGALMHVITHTGDYARSPATLKSYTLMSILTSFDFRVIITLVSY